MEHGDRHRALLRMTAEIQARMRWRAKRSGIAIRLLLFIISTREISETSCVAGDSRLVEMKASDPAKPFCLPFPLLKSAFRQFIEIRRARY